MDELQLQNGENSEDSATDAERRQNLIVIKEESQVELKLREISNEAGCNFASATVGSQENVQRAIKNKNICLAADVDLGEMGQGTSKRKSKAVMHPTPSTSKSEFVSLITSTPKVDLSSEKLSTDLYRHLLSMSPLTGPSKSASSEKEIVKISDNEQRNVTDDGYQTMSPQVNATHSNSSETSKKKTFLRKKLPPPKLNKYLQNLIIFRFHQRFLPMDRLMGL